MAGVNDHGESNGRPRLPASRRALYAAISLLLVAAFGEVAIRVAAALVPGIRYHLNPPWSRNVVNDPALGYRMSPFYPEHDERGYRNPKGSKPTDIVAIGDSTTYGFGVPVNGSWPSLLAAVSRRAVYNAGVGGYGPCEYGQVAAELLPSHPKVVVLVIYLGNDLIDAYRSVYVDKRCADLQSTDPKVLDAIRNADEAGTLQAQAEALGDVTARGAAAETGIHGLALVQLTRAVVDRVRNATWTELHYRPGETYESSAKRPFRFGMDTPAGFKTVFRDPRLYTLASNIDDPRQAEGLRIIETSTARIAASLAAAHLDFVVGVLGSKPNILAPMLKVQRPDVWSKIDSAAALEARAIDHVKAALAADHIEVIDLTAAAADAVQRGETPYPITDDHHFTPIGNRIIAQALMESGPLRRSR